MKKTIDQDDFILEFEAFNCGDEFSREGFYLLYNHLIELEESYGEEWELYVLDLCNSYMEIPCLEFVNDYNLDVKDYLDDYEEDEFNYDNYLKPISDILINDFPEIYKDYKILSDKLVKKVDETEYYRILLIGIYEDDIWLESSGIYFITDIDYKFSEIAETICSAVEIGESLSPNFYNLTLQEKRETKKITWETVDEELLEEAIRDYVEARSGCVGFTRHGTVIFEDF